MLFLLGVAGHASGVSKPNCGPDERRARRLSHSRTTTFSESRLRARCEHLAVARCVRQEEGRRGVSEQEVRTLDALRAEGRRITTARRLVIELLAADDRAPHRRRLWRSRMHDAHPEIHLSTVYRTLDSLHDWELVEHVHQPHGPSFFHLAGAHRHLVCEQCGRIHDVPATEFDALVARGFVSSTASSCTSVTSRWSVAAGITPGAKSTEHPRCTSLTDT